MQEASCPSYAVAQIAAFYAAKQSSAIHHARSSVRLTHDVVVHRQDFSPKNRAQDLGIVTPVNLPIELDQMFTLLLGKLVIKIEELLLVGAWHNVHLLPFCPTYVGPRARLHPRQNSFCILGEIDNPDVDFLVDKA